METCMKMTKFNNVCIPKAKFWGWLHLVIQFLPPDKAQSEAGANSDTQRRKERYGFIYKRHPFYRHGSFFTFLLSELLFAVNTNGALANFLTGPPTPLLFGLIISFHQIFPTKITSPHEQRTPDTCERHQKYGFCSAIPHERNFRLSVLKLDQSEFPTTRLRKNEFLCSHYKTFITWGSRSLASSCKLLSRFLSRLLGIWCRHTAAQFKAHLSQGSSCPRGPSEPNLAVGGSSALSELAHN